MRRSGTGLFVVATLTLLVAPSARAIPGYARLYGTDCTSCHSMWGSLNVNGATFRLSGYRAMAGQELPQVEKPIEFGNGLLTLPGTFPASLITGVAIEVRSETRDAPAALRDTGESGKIERVGANLTVADASIFLSAPLGKHLSFFIEFPMFESKAWEFTPTGPAEARDTTRGNLQLPTEKPIFEVAKFWWNNLHGDSNQVYAIEASPDRCRPVPVRSWAGRTHDGSAHRRPMRASRAWAGTGNTAVHVPPACSQ